jgi:hypothetical protein
MADNSYKAMAIAHDLTDRLKARLNSSLAVVESFDTDGNPLITVGAGVALGANMVIKVRAQDWPLAKDVLGLSANIYAPHVVQFVTEANYAATSDNVADTLSPAQLLLLMGQIVLMGCAVEWYQTVTGVAPVASAITTTVSGNNLGLKGSFAPDERYPLISQQ